MSFSTFDAYRTAKRLGSFSALYRAVGNPHDKDHADAVKTLALMNADAHGDAGAFGARLCVNAAFNGEPYATTVDGPTVTEIT